MISGDRVIVIDRAGGSSMFIGIVCRDNAGAFVWADGATDRIITLESQEEGIVWTRGDNLNSREADALRVACAL